MVLSHYKIWASHSKVFCPFHGNKRSMAGHQWIGIPGPISVQFALPVTPFLSLFFCSLGFSVTIFCTEAMIAIGILLLRRNQSVSGGELGGPKCIKTITSLIFMSLWFVYIGLSAMEAYGVITPGIWISQPPPLSPPPISFELSTATRCTGVHFYHKNNLSAPTMLKNVLCFIQDLKVRFVLLR